ncbi:hypothetical protein DNFV4_00087 [Nitrospira tepida]|uniref:EfeO-type cupredoxin-like domain-containing protein n=1 Tax=Nitrospira tepida TaxID=2973512 RepID=A0AA86MVB4_9BACT|nr:hypothetical protein [Nitrospira tepida]CAI4029669.1 hypothetical protein DNFV4_00087 [Nitrospira tepida]
MRMRGCPKTMLAVPLALAALTLPGLGTGKADAQAPGMAAPVQELTIVIKDRDHGYELLKGTAMAGSLMKITVRNEDSVTHGFTSHLFQNLPVKLEGQGKEVKGKKIRSFHLDPGQVMTLTFTKPSDVQRDGLYGGNEAYTQYHTIWCDIHPEVRGELLVVETSGVPGGG